MSPIRQDTIKVEAWTKRDGRVKKQILAEGDELTPGVWKFIRGVRPGNKNHIEEGPDRIVDVFVDTEGKVVETPSPWGVLLGVWERVKGKERE